MNGGKKPIQPQAPGSMDDRKVALLRTGLAGLGLLLWYERGHFGPAWAAILTANVVYAAITYSIARRREESSQSATLVTVAVDILAYSIMAFAGILSPAIFIVFFSFPVLVISVRVMALYRLASRLALLKELSVTGNPRLGVDRTAGLFIQRVLEFFDADTCVLAQLGANGEKFEVREATRSRPQGGAQPAPNRVNAADLAALPRNAVAVYSEGGRPSKGFYRIVDPGRRTAIEQPAEKVRSIAGWLNTRSFIVAPLRRNDVFRGYVFVGAFRTRLFGREDALFLQEVADQIVPVLEHIRLVDHLASEAADEERRRIARSIHDRIIQPYLGLQIGLKSVHQMIRSEVHADNDDASREKWQRTVAALESLIAMTRDGVAELRQYVYGLKQAVPGRCILVESIARYASKFETATGIHVQVIDRIGRLDIQDRLSADIFQMAAEALSNVHRHTTANSVTLVIEAGKSGTVVLRVENEITSPGNPRAFRPSSISDRADALGGKTEVGVQDGRTVVRVEIPL